MKLVVIGLTCLLIDAVSSINLYTGAHHNTKKSLSHKEAWEVEDSQKCGVQDVDCWKAWFQQKFTCEKSDSHCWGALHQQFTCGLSSVFCWNNQVVQFPCGEQDTDCLAAITPENAPCKIGESCWDDIKYSLLLKDAWENSVVSCMHNDIDCWREWFKSKLKCRFSDRKCWTEANSKFTCSLSDILCWDLNVRDFPCQLLDDNCLAAITPKGTQCNIGERCWRDFRK